MGVYEGDSTPVRFVQACVSPPRSEAIQCWKMQASSATQAHTSTLETRQVGVHTVPESRNCAATSDQSVITTKYLLRREHACQHYHILLF